MNIAEALKEKLTTYCMDNQIELTEQNFHLMCKQALTNEEYETCFLSDEFSKEVDRLAIEGDKYFEEGKFKSAIKLYIKGIALIPEPQDDWETKLWFTAAISDAYWYQKNYRKALKYLDESLEVEKGEENPFIRLRRGQTLFELNKLNQAKKELKMAHRLGGDELFEEEDKKYLKIVNQ